MGSLVAWGSDVFVNQVPYGNLFWSIPSALNTINIPTTYNEYYEVCSSATEYSVRTQVETDEDKRQLHPKESTKKFVLMQRCAL